MKQETVTAMNLATKEANRVYQHLCGIALEIADLALRMEEGKANQTHMMPLLGRYETARKEWEIAFAKEQAALLRWQNEFDRRERITS